MPRKNSMDTYSPVIGHHGPVVVHGNAWFHHPWYARNVLCSDGRRRTAYFGADGSYGYVRVKIGSKWQRGFLSQVSNDAALSSNELDLEFIAAHTDK